MSEKKYRHPDLQIGDKVHGPGNVIAGNSKRLVMTVKEIDTNPAQSAKIKTAQDEDVRHVLCTYTLNDVEHVEEFREDSLTKVS